ncbi:MAG TPA: DnaJ domain-containing protein [Methylomirabilota bacterium]|nr:DnaJ domain-containing protein [Methylomirabilota bacterium]
MNAVVIALVAGIAGLFVLRWFLNANPAVIASNWRLMVMILGFGLAGVLAMTGRIGLAIPLAAFLLTLYSRGVLKSPRASRLGGGQKQKSMVRSAAFEMELDHETGTMTGRVLAGSFEGRDLDTLDAPALSRLAAEIEADAESRALLEAYLDRRMPGWREHMKADAGAGQRRPAHAGAMSEEEAYQILGLEKGAREPEIRAAHRRLMKKMHPDSGGSTFLAARINEAKDRLLSKHR